MRLYDIVQTGDLLFASGDSWISKAIKKLTSGRTNHVGIVYDRTKIFETDIKWGKAEFHDLSKYEDHKIIIIRCTALHDEALLMRLCDESKNKPYSWLDIATNAILSPFNDGIRSKLVGLIGNKKHEICSEMSGRIMYEATKLKELAHYEGLTPQDLLKICFFNPALFQVVYQHPQF